MVLYFIYLFLNAWPRVFQVRLRYEVVSILKFVRMDDACSIGDLNRCFIIKRIILSTHLCITNHIRLSPPC